MGWSVTPVIIMTNLRRSQIFIVRKTALKHIVDYNISSNNLHKAICAEVLTNFPKKFLQGRNSAIFKGKFYNIYLRIFFTPVKNYLVSPVF